jgi:hypothetical protein
MGRVALDHPGGVRDRYPPAGSAVTARTVIARSTKMIGILGDLSGHDRIEAVHQTFSERSSSDAIEALFWIGLFGLLLIGVLLLLHRVQRFLQKRQDARTALPGPRPRNPQPFASRFTHPKGRPITPRSPVKSRP